MHKTHVREHDGTSVVLELHKLFTDIFWKKSFEMLKAYIVLHDELKSLSLPVNILSASMEVLAYFHGELFMRA